MVITLCVSITGCASIVEKTGQLLDGTVFLERTVAVHRSSGVNGRGIEVREMLVRENRAAPWERCLFITPEGFPALQIRTSLPGEDGTFSLASLDYLGGNEHGWNRFEMGLLGSGRFVQDSLGTMSRVWLHAGFVPLEISSARIRRYDDRIVGDEALRYISNRHERILAMVEWMKERTAPSGMRLAEFEAYWKPILFPEIVRSGSRPAGWTQAGDTMVRAENISWNAGYTERTFPELLWNVRNSGTMLRDWEEAMEWIHINYEWEALTRQLLRETIVFRTRR
jgi:hypothetical protein